MSKKKGKFDLTKLVHDGALADKEIIFFVSNPQLFATLEKQPNGEFKIHAEEGTTTIHAFAQKCLGTEPPDHATRWFRTQAGKTIYEVWQASEENSAAA